MFDDSTTDPPGNPWHRLAVLVMVGWTLISAPAAAEESANERHACLRCHSMATMAYRDPQTWEIVDLSISPHALAASVHGELACTKCHAPELRRYPHPESAKHQRLSCIGCHEKDSVDSSFDFERVKREFKQSVHVAPGAKHADRFRCHSCHDPHGFRVSRVGKDLARIVQDDNHVCLSCHTTVADPALKSHDWLPKPERHWGAVRCVECHTPASTEPSRISHQILPADEANRDCVQCHSKDARLLDRLYAYRSAEDLKHDGLLSKALFNEAYVVGMSRNRTLDAISLVVLALTVLGLGLHGYGRYRAHRRMRDQS